MRACWTSASMLLQTKGGHTVAGDGGPTTFPDNTIEIAPDGIGLGRADL